MAAKWRWVDRTFTFDFPVEKFPDILERYRGTPARVADRIRGLDRAALTWEGRLDDYLAGNPTLRAADMSNAATHAAGHDARDPADLLAALRAARGHIITRLESLRGADWARVATHPRLQQPLRLVDAIAFTCDHDDYHLARISELVRLAPQAPPAQRRP